MNRSWNFRRGVLLALASDGLIRFLALVSRGVL